MRVHSSNEWGKLKSIVVGTATGANWPMLDPTFATNWETTLFRELPHPKGKVSRTVVDEANEDLEDLCAALKSAGIAVYRPMDMEYASRISTPKWGTDMMYGYCPRDTHLVVDDIVIEAPMCYRARQLESDNLGYVRAEAIRDGARWMAAPRPMLMTGSHRVEQMGCRLTEDEPIFDAANCLRLGDDILYLRSSTGNELGAKWLQGMLPHKRIHVLRNIYAYAHLDSTIAPIREGLVVLNGKRVGRDAIPEPLDKWDAIWFDDPVPTPYYMYPYASEWIGMNLLMIDPSTAIVDAAQVGLIQQLESYGIEVWPLRLRHARTLGGGFHCVTLDLERE